jgi:methyl-accepting chemotaxis protein
MSNLASDTTLGVALLKQLFARDVSMESKTAFGEHAHSGYDPESLKAAISSVLAGTITEGELDAGHAHYDVIKHLLGLLNHRDTSDLKHDVDLSMRASETSVTTANLLGKLSETDQGLSVLASGMVEMSSSIEQLANFAEQAAVKVETLDEDMGRASDATYRSAENTKQLGDRFAEMMISLEEVREASGQIAGFATMVEAIAQQTNLLALNATIEAARAGDAGKGFAVVATEVKTLSDQTRKATEDIRSRIKLLTGVVAGMADTMTGVKAFVDSNAQESRGVAEEIRQVQTTVSVVGEHVTMMSQTLGQQNQAVSEMAGQIQSMSELAARSKADAGMVMQSLADCDSLLASHLDGLAKGRPGTYVLYRAKADHVLWKKRLAGMFSGHSKLASAELGSHHQCRLGKWYDAVTNQTLKNSMAFKELLVPHEAVHRHGIAAAIAYENGDRLGAEAEMEKMSIASTKVLKLLDDLIEIEGRQTA